MYFRIIKGVPGLGRVRIPAQNEIYSYPYRYYCAVYYIGNYGNLIGATRIGHQAAGKVYRR